MGAYAHVLAPGRRCYSLSLAIFLASLGLLLFTVVEIRRAFLFPLADYVQIGAPSAILSFTPGHVPLLMLAGLGIWLGYSSLTRLEGRLRGATLKVLTNVLAAAIMMFLVVDLFIHRGVPASRIAAAGKMGVGCQRPPYTEPPGSGKRSHPGSPIESQSRSPMWSHPGAAIGSQSVRVGRVPCHDSQPGRMLYT